MNKKEEVLRFILESTEEERENLGIFIAGMNAQKRASAMHAGKNGCEVDAPDGVFKSPQKRRKSMAGV